MGLRLPPGRQMMIYDRDDICMTGHRTSTRRMSRRTGHTEGLKGISRGT